MTRNTAKHDWTVPTAGDDDYEITFDELFTDFDTDIEVRDEEQFLSSYDPDLNAKFVATDTGNIYLGDGNSWNQYPVQPEAEAVEDVVGGLLNGGTNVSLNYDDASNVLTVNTSALNQEEVEDAVASLVTAGNAITVNYDDNADALSIDVNESALSFYDGTNLTADIDATNGTFNSVNTIEALMKADGALPTYRRNAPLSLRGSDLGAGLVLQNQNDSVSQGEGRANIIWASDAGERIATMTAHPFDNHWSLYVKPDPIGSGDTSPVKAIDIGYNETGSGDNIGYKLSGQGRYDFAGGTYRYGIGYSGGISQQLRAGPASGSTILFYADDNAAYSITADPGPNGIFELYNYGLGAYSLRVNSTNVWDFNGAVQRNVRDDSVTTSNRPNSPNIGQRVFDNDLGQPIWYDGSDWVDALGDPV